MKPVKRKQAFANYVRAVADQMMLKDWDGSVYFSDDVEHVDHYQERPDFAYAAQVVCTPHRKHFDMTISDKILESDNHDDVRQTVTHELVHVHFSAMWDQVRVDLLKHLSQQGYDLFVASFERNMEWGVDALADALAPHMPVWNPDEWAPDKARPETSRPRRKRT